MPGPLRSDAPQDRPGDFLRTRVPRLRVVAPEPDTPVVRIPEPPQPWVQDARVAAARLDRVPAFVPRLPGPVAMAAAAPPRAAPPCPASRGVRRPAMTRDDPDRTAPGVVFGLALALLLWAVVAWLLHTARGM